ncbi:hypothetical protein B9Z39_10340 [Limnohabitans sp. JirII-29]|nr:hypothetical protein B9Z39_10340 [Limnohabitans sp. JirII-29]
MRYRTVDKVDLRSDVKVPNLIAPPLPLHAESFITSPEIWRYVFDALDNPVFLHDLEFRVMLANKAYCKIAEFNEKDAIGQVYWQVFPKGPGPMPGCQLAAAGHGHTGSQEEVTVNGRCYLSKGYTVRNEQDTALYSLHVFTDITEQKKAERQLLRFNHMYRTISHGNKALVYAKNEIDLVRTMCQVLVKDGGFLAAWVGFAEPDTKRILPVAAVGTDEMVIAGMNLTWEDNQSIHEPTGVAVRSGKITVSQDILNDPLWLPWRDLALERGYAAAASFPLKANDRVLGALDIYGAEADVFAPDMLELLAELADDLAFGISNLRSRSDRFFILEKLEQSLDHAITAIAATVEMRDPYIAGHQRRVAKLASAIALDLDLPTDQIQGLHMACVVHDIGKIHVPAEILVNPGKLTDAEFEIIKTHPKAGWEILKGIDFMWPVAEIVYQHHEKLNGSGYPRGLQGDAICIEARILTVADVVEAMSSLRPYRAGLGVFLALQEISRNKGVLYDTAVVESCLRVFMEKNFEW